MKRRGREKQEREKENELVKGRIGTGKGREERRRREGNRHGKKQQTDKKGE